MRYFVRALPLLVLSITCLNTPAIGQVSATWFDINPNRSNTDADNPNGASGGRVNHVGAAADFSRTYAATEFGGLYTSFDQGNTWVKINSFSPTTTWDVKVDPRNSKRVYATSFFDGRALNPQSGISVSDDAGNSWTPVNIPGLNGLNCAVAARRNQPSAWQISISPTNTQTVFVGTSCGLARLQNGVWNFIDPSPGSPAEQIYAVVAHGAQIVDVIGDNGHLRSPDNGANWSPVPAGPGPTAVNSGPTNTIAVSPQESYVLLAANLQCVVGVGCGNNIWESDDGGATWPTSLTPPLGNFQGRIPFVKTNQLSTSTQFDVWFGDINLFKTTANTPTPPAQGGAARTPVNSWTNAQAGSHADVGDVMFDPRFTSGACPRIFSNDGGVYVNVSVNNPGCQSPSWEQPNITPHATWVWGFDGLRIIPGMHGITYGLQDAGGFAGTNVIEGYSPPVVNWNNYVCCDVSDNSQDSGRMVSLEGFFQGRNFRLFKRSQDGSGGSEIPNYPSTGTFSGFDSGKGNARFAPNGYAVNLSDGVYFTNNITGNPIGWTALNAPTAPNSGSGSIKIANLGGRPNIFYHTANGNPANPGLIFRSSLVPNTGAPGANWTPLPLPATIGSVTVYDVDPNNGNRIIISGVNSVTQNFEMWITRDFGGSWNPLPQLDNLMLGNTAAGNTFLNRSNQGIAMGGGTFNFGTSWQPSMLQFNPNGGTTIAAGAVDAGVFLSLDDGANWQLISNPITPNSNAPHIPRPIAAYFSPGRFNANTNSFDMWVATRGAGIMKVVLDQRPPPG